MWWSAKTELWDEVKKAINPVRLKGGSWAVGVFSKDWVLGLDSVGARSCTVGKGCPGGCLEECPGDVIGVDADGIANRRYICSISSRDLFVWTLERSET